jgi:hypothetical protein
MSIDECGENAGNVYEAKSAYGSYRRPRPISWHPCPVERGEGPCIRAMLPDGNADDKKCQSCSLRANRSSPTEPAERVVRGARQARGPALRALKRQLGHSATASQLEAVAALETLSGSPLDHQWLVLWGKPGAGKTRLLRATQVSCAGSAAYITAMEFTRQITAIRLPSLQHRLLEALVEVPVLLLDDLGFEPTSSLANWALQTLIRRRYGYGTQRPTVVATALGQASLNERYPSLASRCLDRELSRVIRLSVARVGR